MIYPHHLEELLKSCIDQGIIDLNCESVEGDAVYDHLCYSDKLGRTNTGRLERRYINAYSLAADDGMWWCSGEDPLNNYAPMLWGCGKPDRPRTEFNGPKPIKYEHPPKVETRIFLLSVPEHIWEKVAERYGVAITDEDRTRSFWAWVHKNNIPIILTEGAKKAGCLLSAGFAGIAIPGVFNGYRTPKDEFGNKTGRPRLIPDLQHFATMGREIFICFDRDQNPKTIRNVNNAISETGYLFVSSGCHLRVVCLPGPEKGVDDFVVAQGTVAFEELYRTAPTLDNWRAQSFTQLTYPADLTIERRYFGEISIPSSAQLVCLKGGKGTGKTQVLESIVSEALFNGQWVLVVGHRVQLVEALCARFGLPYVTEVRTSDTGKTLGYGLCLDSLHPQSQARFTAQGWHDGVVIIDEAEQVFWHGLNSSTCQTERIPILRELKTLLGNVLQGNGQVFLSDADLSDLSIDFVKALAGINVAPWVVINEWKPGDNERWDINNYSGADPSGLVAALESDIDAGGRPLVCCSAQKAKSKWGTRNLEAHLTQMFPKKRILRIDSESIADPSHPAFGAIANLNQLLGSYDIVLASPSIETGVSIDIKGHFTSCWGIFQGVQAESSARQSLARLREPVPRHIWAARYGIGKIGNGSTSVKSLLASQHKLTRANIRLLQDSAFDDLDLNFQPEALLTWGKMAVRVNLGMARYRAAIVGGLKAEGHRIIEALDCGDDELKAAIAATQTALHTAEAEAIAAACDITQAKFDRLQEQKAKTQTERYQERKFGLGTRYGVEVTPDLVLKDDDSWYPQLRLHYFLTLGRDFLPQRDRQRARSQSEKGNGAVFLPDFNRGQLSAPVALLEKLGVLELLDGREVTGVDEGLQQMATTAYANRWGIKAVLGISINEKDTPIAIAQKLLSKCGLSLTCVGRRGSRGDRQRVYRYVDLEDGRADIFAAWFARDEATVSLADSDASTPHPDELVSTLGNKEVSMTPPVDTQTESPQIEGPLVRCQKFGQMFRFSLQRFIDGATAEIKSILTGEVFQVPTSQLAPWGGGP